MSSDPRPRSAPTPTLSASQASSILRDHYGLEGSLDAQPSERDQNFLLRGRDGERHVLKIANAAEPAIVTDFQVAALLHIADRNPALKVPRVVRTVADDNTIRITADDGGEHTVRVLSWLPGIPLCDAEPRPDIAEPLGRQLAELDQALRDFEHPGSDYPLLWDIKQARNLEPLLASVEESDLRATLRRRLDSFKTGVEPRFRDLRWQVIFNDLNASNVLVDPDDTGRIAGIIDFGDMIRSPLVIDVAVACAYLVRDDDEPLAAVFDFVRGFDAVTPLMPDEFDLLPELIAMRNLLTIVISSWRAAEHPANRDYLLRSQAHALRMFAVLGAQRPAGIGRELRRFCGR